MKKEIFIDSFWVWGVIAFLLLIFLLLISLSAGAAMSSLPEPGGKIIILGKKCPLIQTPRSKNSSFGAGDVLDFETPIRLAELDVSGKITYLDGADASRVIRALIDALLSYNARYDECTGKWRP